jgi:DNA-binding transcriptional MerR regulator/methylmalonyl-CoA mutase cobalamin-binding subunit
VKGPRYRIRAVSKLTGIPVDTLRAWERRHGVVAPARDERGRLYSPADVERLRLLRSAVEGGHAIGRVAPLANGELVALLAQPATGAPTPVEANLSALQDAVDRLDAAAFRRELSRLAAILPLRAFCRDVILPFLHRVGDAWHDGQLGVAQEHMASAEIRSLLGALARLHELRDGAPALVLATPAGELHEIGTLAAAVVASEAGLRAVYLGPNVPSAEVVSAASRVSAKAVVLGWTGGGDRGKGPAVSIADVARDLPGAIELWVGGEGAPDAARATRGRAMALATFAAFEHALSRIHVR